jgi:tartrate dehydrogenase/decarboxylase / D-malate dehydrogenase
VTAPAPKPLSRVGVLAGDGVGPEVILEGCKVLEATGVGLELVDLPWGSAYYREHGVMMPPDGLDVVRGLDAVLLGAIGTPELPDDVTLWGLLFPFRQQLDLWANLRPVRLLDGVPCPLAGRGPADVDMLFVRENTEGEYAGVGGRVHRGLPSELAVEGSVFTRAAIERLVRYSFVRARARRGRLTSATKSNASRYGYVLWDDVVDEVAADFADVETERVLVDALAARMVRNPDSLDVVVASNLFGDILTDLAGAIQGGLGMCASANVAPGSGTTGIFEPVHGSAPDIAGQGIANPAGAIWSAALLLEHIGQEASAERVLQALGDACRDGIRTRDIGGSATTTEVGDAVAARVRELV